MEQIEAYLKTLALFNTFSTDILKELVNKSHVSTYSPGELIINFGQPGKFLGVILSGAAEAVVSGANGGRQRMGQIKQGEFLGEMSLLTGEPTSADVIALKKCEILLIPQDTFSVYLASNAEAIKVMAKAMNERLRNRSQSEDAQARAKDAWRSTQDPYGFELTTTEPMKILVLNSGSSSLKFNFYDTEDEKNFMKGLIEKIGSKNALISVKSKYSKNTSELGIIGYREALRVLVDTIADPVNGVIRDLSQLTAVGHRVVHGGDTYSGAVVINDEVINEIENNSILAPLHNPVNLMGIKEAMRLLPGVPQVAVFDTGFHQKMPPEAYLYGLPYDYFKEDRIRRYGFHGISHNYVALKAAEHLKRDFRDLKIISCHLGNGASICAIDHGRSVDTSMGFTPLEGLIMGTRSGDLDPSIVLHLASVKGLSIDEINNVLNHDSGLLGLSGISSDFRELEEAANRSEPRAILTAHTFAYRIRKYIGSYMAALGGLDVMIFTGGIGEGSAWVRGLSCQGLSHMGIVLDEIRNRTGSATQGSLLDISGDGSRVKVLVIPTDEERMIARETIGALNKNSISGIIRSKQGGNIPIEVSAHHIHLSQKDIEKLFGPNYSLTKRSDLSQPGQYACEETVDLIGPKGRVERVRVLGPTRNQTQVEVSMTEEYSLGISAPIRPSGDLDGSPGIVIEGPKDSCEISQGVICALRHIHMTPEDALSLGLKDKDIVMVQIEGERTLTFGDVLVRVNPDFQLYMHIDTDEANAANITTGWTGKIVSIQERRY